MAQPPNHLKQTILASIFAALIAAGAFIAIPIGPVPIVLQNFFILLAAMTLSWRWALTSVVVYILAGILGLPVFSAGRSGIGHILGPTGGYLVSYIPVVLIVGFFTDILAEKLAPSSIKRILLELLVLILGSSVIYIIGASWLKILLSVTWSKALTIGVLPFLIGDLVKIGVVIPVARYTQKLISTDDRR